MLLDLTNYPTDTTHPDDPPGYTCVPEDWIWWECTDCGDYAWLAPGADEPECSCNIDE